MLNTLDVYEFNMVIFKNKKLEYFLLFHHNLNIMLGTSRAITEGVKMQYLCMLLCGETLREFERLCAHIGHTNSAHLKLTISGRGTYIFLINTLSNQKCAMLHVMSNLCKLKAK